MTRHRFRFLIALSLLLTAGGPAIGQPVILNGGFDSGFANWTRVDQLGSEGTFALQSGTLSPVNGMIVPSPPGALNAAMTDSQGPGSHLLFQDFAVPAIGVLDARLQFDLFIGNRSTAFITPSTLDFSTPALNQQARVDLLSPTANPFSVAVTDIYQNLYRTNVGDPLVAGYTTFLVDVTPQINLHAGEMVRLRFAEVDNVNFFQFGVDNVSMKLIPVPEPATGGLVAFTFLGAWRRRLRLADAKMK